MEYTYLNCIITEKRLNLRKKNAYLSKITKILNESNF